mmetsp:Transcript_64323/g.143053  ORF Transcript_64323/g.143053 Transcript_64323/m.143053 type:complete len:201 (-) Transcript_64323:84-686(-)
MSAFLPTAWSQLRDQLLQPLELVIGAVELFLGPRGSWRRRPAISLHALHCDGIDVGGFVDLNTTGDANIPFVELQLVIEFQGFQKLCEVLSGGLRKQRHDHVRAIQAREAPHVLEDSVVVLVELCHEDIEQEDHNNGDEHAHEDHHGGVSLHVLVGVAGQHAQRDLSQGLHPRTKAWEFPDVVVQGADGCSEHEHQQHEG